MSGDIYICEDDVRELGVLHLWRAERMCCTECSEMLDSGVYYICEDVRECAVQNV